jgi:hypothetical protein
MRRWGIVITLFYAAVLALLLFPAGLWLTAEKPDSYSFASAFRVYREWLPWVVLAIPVSGQALLLFLSVDTSWRRVRPRQHIGVTVVLAGLCAAMLTSSGIWALAAGIAGDKSFDLFFSTPISKFFGMDAEGATELIVVITVWLGLWIVWGIVFLMHHRSSSEMLSKIVSWLLKGSVLELLIAVPAHIVARQRGDCSAPMATGFGIVTGVAIMLMCFGPSVLALYAKKLRSYSPKPALNSNT